MKTKIGDFSYNHVGSTPLLQQINILSLFRSRPTDPRLGTGMASITTGGGDGGRTSLMFGRRVSKGDPRVAACGEIDELSAALGLARAALRRNDASEKEVDAELAAVQENLILVMGELAVLPEDRDRYVGAGYRFLDRGPADRLTERIRTMESSADLKFEGWVLPGASGQPAAASLDFARAVCRRCERAPAVLDEQALPNDAVRVFFNRLSDYLWLAARVLERREAEPPPANPGG